MTSQGWRWIVFLAVVFLLACAKWGHALDLNGPLWSFGCSTPRVVDGAIVCPPSAGFSSSVTISWVEYVQGNASRHVAVNDSVFFNGSSSELTVTDVGLVPELPSSVLLFVLLFVLPVVSRKPP